MPEEQQETAGERERAVVENRDKRRVESMLKLLICCYPDARLMR